MKQTMRTAVPLAFFLLPLFIGCGGNKGARMMSLAPRGSGTLVIRVDWGNSRVIPPEAVRIDVTVTGDGLREPRRASIDRPRDTVTVTDLPVGSKTVLGEAKNADNRTVARGTGFAVIREGESSSVAITMETVPAGGERLTVTVFRGETQDNADFFAYQDGEGAWQTASGSGGVYTLNITDRDGRYGVVAYAGYGQSRHVLIVHATLAELNRLSIELPVESLPPMYEVTGDVRGLPAGSDVRGLVAMGPEFGFFSSYDPWFRFHVPAGLYDLWAHYQRGEDGFVRGYLRRDINVTANTRLDVDFTDTLYAITPVPMNINVTGIPIGWMATVFHSFVSRNGTRAFSLGSFGSPEPRPSLSGQVSSIPSERLQTGDILAVEILASLDGNVIYRNQSLSSPRTLNITLPQPFTSARTTVAATSPYTRTETSWTPYPGAQAYFLEVRGMFGRASRPASLGSLGNRRQYGGTTWAVAMTVGWLGTRSSYTLPDLSSLPGWDNQWGLSSTGLSWEMGAVFANRPLAQWVDKITVAGGSPPSQPDLEFTVVSTEGES